MQFPRVKSGCVRRACLRCVKLSPAAGILLVAALSGCSLSPMAKHTAIFSKAANTVIDNSENAYRGANELREREQITAAVYDYGKPGWDPYTEVKPLLTADQLQARLDVLDGLRAYADTLVALTNPAKKDSEELETAAAGAGQNLQTLSGSLNANFSKAIPAMSDTETNVVSTALVALGSYLQNKKLKGALPKITAEMDPNVKTLCGLLNADVKVLRRDADRNYTELVTMQNQFIEHEGGSLNPIQKREEIRRVLMMAADQKQHDRLLASLQDALGKLALTHHALAAQAQGNNPEDLRQKIAELAAAGQSLGNFYKSLSSSQTASAH